MRMVLDAKGTMIGLANCEDGAISIARKMIRHNRNDRIKANLVKTPNPVTRQMEQIYIVRVRPEI